MASNLPITEVAARPMFVPLETSLGALTARYNELKAKPLTRMVVEEAKELDTDAKAFIAQAEASEARQAIDSAYKVHRFLSSMFKKATDPALEIRRWASGTLARWEQQRRAAADAERRQREEEARQAQEDRRIAEAAHLESQGHVEEAKAHLEAPMPPVVLPDAKEPAGKVEGVSVIDTYKLDKIVDAKALAGYLVDHPDDLIALFEPKAGVWKRRATDAKGQWQVPGVTFVMVPETRNRG